MGGKPGFAIGKPGFARCQILRLRVVVRNSLAQLRFAGVDGGAPVVDCPSSCTAPQGTILYAVTVAGDPYASPPTPASEFVGWSVVGAEGGVNVSTALDFQIVPGTGSPITATFTTASNGPDAAAPPAVHDAGGGGG